MKLQQNTHKTKIILGIIIAVSLGLLATGALAYKYDWGPFANSASDQEGVKDAQNNSDTTNDQQKDSKDQVANPNVDTSKTTDQIPVSTSATVSIAELAQKNGSVTIASNVTNPGTSATCSAQFTSDVARPVSRTVDAVNGSCPEISIPEQEFSAIGAWKLTLRYYTADTQAVDTKTIEIK